MVAPPKQRVNLILYKPGEIKCRCPPRTLPPHIPIPVHNPGNALQPVRGGRFVVYWSFTQVPNADIPACPAKK